MTVRIHTVRPGEEFVLFPQGVRDIVVYPRGYEDWEDEETGESMSFLLREHPHGVELIRNFTDTDNSSVVRGSVGIFKGFDEAVREACHQLTWAIHTAPGETNRDGFLFHFGKPYDVE